MKAFFDTSVLVAALVAHHQFHRPSIELLIRFEKNEACCGAHSLAEIFATLTGRTGRDRVGADEAILFLRSLQERLTIVGLSEREYLAAIEASAGEGVAGGTIYDAILGHCALKARAQTIYTWNIGDFKRLGAAIGGRSRTPSD